MRLPDVRLPCSRRLRAALPAALVAFSPMSLAAPLPAQTTESEPGATRIVALNVDAGRLGAGSLGEALAVRTGFDAPVDVVLHGWRIVHGGTVAEHTSGPFPVPSGGSTRPADVDALPAASFYGGGDIGSDDVVADIPTTATAVVTDPAALVTRNAGRLPPGWQDREVLVFVAVPADGTAAATAGGVTAVIALGAATRNASGGSGGVNAGGGSSDVASLLRRHLEATQMCSGWVKDVTLYRATQGWIVPEYYEAYQGGPACRQIPYQQVVDQWYRDSGEEPTRFTHEYADGLDMLGDALDRGLSGEGFGPIGGGGRALTGTMSDFVRAGAEVDSDTLLVDDVERRMSDMAEFARRARLVGTEVVDGRTVVHLRADDLADVELYQPTGPQYSLKSADLWIDEATLGVAGMKFELEAQEGDGGLMTVELRNEGFVTLPNGVVVPARTVMRISGAGDEMSDEERKKMEKALEQVEQMEKDLEKLPAAARGMIEGQIERLKAMSERGGGVLGEAVVRLVHAAVNEGPPVPGGVGDMTLFGHRFERARVLAEWQGDDPARVLPSSLAFVGHANGLTAVLEVGGMDLDKLSEEYGEMPARAQGRLEGGENPVTFGPAFAKVEIKNITLTEAWGFVVTEAGVAVWRAGHMPCSTQPRALGVDLAAESDEVSLIRHLETDDWDALKQEVAGVDACREFGSNLERWQRLQSGAP